MPAETEFYTPLGLVPQTTTADCMICQDPAVDPVTTTGCECRVTYCRDCFMTWLETGANKCPTCPAHWNNLELFLDAVDRDDIYDSDSSDDDLPIVHLRNNNAGLPYDDDSDFSDDTFLLASPLNDNFGNAGIDHEFGSLNRNRGNLGFIRDDSDNQSVDSAWSVDDDENVPTQPPFFGVNVTIEDHREGHEPIYLLRHRSADLVKVSPRSTAFFKLGHLDVEDEIGRFRRTSLDRDMPIETDAPRRAYVKAWLLIDHLLVSANKFYRERLPAALQNSQATEKDFIAMVCMLGITITKELDRTTATYERLRDNLLKGCFERMAEVSDAFLDIQAAHQENREMVFDPIQRYLQDLAEDLAHQGERVYERVFHGDINW
ncbi:hypothetical protein CB0940_11211 [Cercospora beticola]|uniref:RING-type domain-containing protein n=1 Tax=Cercospora beticola TaxID=122368 RepID=A0A2G5HCM2_CERBT|nr:hypothetical protein CB0940_11211 [Cercospora beticola]PIA90281.1 hypothetical protein CB0940_11211 [Cercospora beticola]CAK1368095.1 unnamed protein product [Cercospora beticola]